MSLGPRDDKVEGSSPAVQKLLRLVVTGFGLPCDSATSCPKEPRTAPHREHRTSCASSIELAVRSFRASQYSHVTVTRTGSRLFCIASPSSMDGERLSLRIDARWHRFRLSRPMPASITTWRDGAWTLAARQSNLCATSRQKSGRTAERSRGEREPHLFGVVLRAGTACHRRGGTASSTLSTGTVEPLFLALA
jgi:hypothetical protein